MKSAAAVAFALLLAAPAFAQTPPPAEPPKQDDPFVPFPGVNTPLPQRPKSIPCESKGGLIAPVVRFCPLPADAPWPPQPKPRPKSGIFPLDRT